tara:strand:- start:1263 stop:1850 length:588 start_codon:yes stop_codon:yes gene_type:complete
MNSFKPNPNYQIEVFDNVLNNNDLTANYIHLLNSYYTYQNFDRNFVLKSTSTPKLFTSFLENGNLINESWNDFSSRLFKCYHTIFKKNIFTDTINSQVNVSDHSTVDMVHSDSWNLNEKYTVLYYANSEWDKDYGGETLFYDAINLEIVAAIKPIPGRFVVFDSAIPHSARPPQMNCPYKRYTVATKNIPQNLDI